MINNTTKKARFIERLNSLSAAQKEKTIAFFTKFPVYENSIEWNNKSLQYHDFEKVFKMADASHQSIKRKAKTNPEILFKNYNCRIVNRTEDFLIVMPLDWECAVFFNSFDCGGTGAKWCIGDKNHFRHWNNYVSDKNIFYLIYFVKKHPVYERKILIQYDREAGEFTTWDTKSAAWSYPSFFEHGSLEVLRKKSYTVRLKRKWNCYVVTGSSFSARSDVLIWYCSLRYEEKIHRQLFFHFDIFESIDLPEETVNNIGFMFAMRNSIEEDVEFLEINDLPKEQDIFENYRTDSP